MNNISLEDINLIQQSKTFEFLSNDGIDSSNIASSIRTFNTDSQNNLKGEAWDKVRAKYSKYDDALTKHSLIATTLSQTIQSTLSELQNAMAGYDSIDLSKLEDLRAQRKSCESKIENINSMMNKKQFSFKSFSFEPVYDNATLQKNLNTESQVLNELDKIIKQMENIKAICDKAEAKLNELLNEMITIEKGIEEITPSVAVAV